MKKIIRLIVLGILFVIFPFTVKAEGRVVNIHMFYGETCPHCAAEEKFFDEYLKDKDNVKLYRYEVWSHPENVELIKKIQKEMGNSDSGVPFTVIGKRIIVGYSDDYTPDDLKHAIEYYLDESHTYRDYAGEITGKGDLPKNENKTEIKKETKKEVKKDDKKYEKTVPVLGKINAKKVSLPLLAVVLGFVDGFNPCAMWILIFLITMLLNMKDRKKMWILGLTFILTSGVIYLMFMLAWLNLATFISKISYIRLAIALVAMIVGIVNLNNYIKSLKKDDGCEVVDKKERKKIMNKIISITNQKKFILALLGIIVLAASVNIVELMCSIGIPLLFTQILAMNNLSWFSYMIYMLIYIIFFLIDDILVFAVSMITLKVTGITTKYTKYSHLIGGIIMLIIGILLILKPEILMFNL